MTGETKPKKSPAGTGLFINDACKRVKQVRSVF